MNTETFKSVFHKADQCEDLITHKIVRITLQRDSLVPEVKFSMNFQRNMAKPSGAQIREIVKSQSLLLNDPKCFTFR